ELGKEKLDVNYVLMTNAAATLHGTIEDIDEKAEVLGEEGNTVTIRVAINSDDVEAYKLDITKGAEVSGKIDCGRRSLGYVWFHDVLEFIQKKILFRW